MIRGRRSHRTKCATPDGKAVSPLAQTCHSGASLIMYARSGRIRPGNLALRPLADTRTASGRTCSGVPT